MAKTYIQELQEQVKRLEVTVESKTAEIRLFESELQDVLTPSVIASRVTCTLAEMVGELLEFEKLKGASDKTRASKKRLVSLILDTEKLNSMSVQLNTLQLANKFLFGQYQLQRIERLKIADELNRITGSENF